MFNIKYSVYEKEDLKEGKNLVISELSQSLEEKGLNIKKIVFVNFIYVSKNMRNKGIGSSILKDLIEKYPGSIILTEAFASKEEYDIQPTEYENEKILERIGNFLKKNNFHDINDYIGKYEHKKVYIYDDFYKNVIMGIKESN